MFGIVTIPLSSASQTGQTPQTPLNHARSQTNTDFQFEVYSLRPAKPGAQGSGGVGSTPDGYVARITTSSLIMTAYAPGGAESWIQTPLLNQPDWIRDGYELNARVADADRQAWQNQGPDRRLLRSALATVLRERFHLAIHEQPTKVPIYELVISKKGASLNAAQLQAPSDCHRSNAGTGACYTVTHSGIFETYHFYGAPLEDLLFLLRASSSGRPIRDMTGLSGRYDFTLVLAVGPIDDEAVFNYKIDALGLELKPAVDSATRLVIDHIEKPSAD
jgi:uncharacterized protein (TIGR03435 family)